MNGVQQRTIPAPGRTLARLWPLLLLLVLTGVVFLLGFDELLSVAALERHREQLLGFVQTHWALASLSFILFYALGTTLSLPCGTVLTLSAGFLFGTAWGTVLAVIGATVGAVAIFLLTRHALRDMLAQRARPWLARMERGFREDAFFYLLAVRLVPLFPFFIVNIVPALLGVRLREYLLATAVGIIPATWIYAALGAGLGTIFADGGEFAVARALTPGTIMALIGLAILALLPIGFKRILRRQGGMMGGKSR